MIRRSSTAIVIASAAATVALGAGALGYAAADDGGGTRLGEAVGPSTGIGTASDDGVDQAMTADGSPMDSATADPVTEAELQALATTQCEHLATEMWEREEDGRITEADYEYGEITEEELETVMVPATPFDGSVLTEGERPEFTGFGDGADVAALDNRSLIASVDGCWEAGLLYDEDLADEDDPDDEDVEEDLEELSDDPEDEE